MLPYNNWPIFKIHSARKQSAASPRMDILHTCGQSSRYIFTIHYIHDQRELLHLLQ